MQNPRNVQYRCPLCQNTKIGAKDRYSKHFLFYCHKCSFVFCNPIPSTEDLNAYYTEYSYGGEYYISPITLKRYREILLSLGKYRKLNRILDVGCGNGIFLSVAKDLGWECYGTEFSDKAVELCQAKGLNVLKGSLADVLSELPQVDIIASIEVIEHLSFPANEVPLFHQLLRPGGALYITTPNFNSITRLFLKTKHTEITYPEHLSYFTARTLSYMLKNSKFKIAYIETTGVSISRLKSALSTKMENPYQTSSTDEKLRKQMEEKMWLGLVKRFINWLLTLTRKGNSLKVLAIRSEL